MSEITFCFVCQYSLPPPPSLPSPLHVSSGEQSFRKKFLQTVKYNSRYNFTSQITSDWNKLEGCKILLEGPPPDPPPPPSPTQRFLQLPPKLKIQVRSGPLSPPLSLYLLQSKLEECESVEEYSACLHGLARSGIENMITSKQECLSFQCNQLLYPGNGMQLYENLIRCLQLYLEEIRRQLPRPKLFQVCQEGVCVCVCVCVRAWMHALWKKTGCSN